jgi:ribosomal protein L4
MSNLKERKMAVKSVVFHSADKIVMADGSVVDHLITHYGETADGYQIDLAPGVEA